MLVTFFPRLWHGNCTAFNAAGPGGAEGRAREIAEHTEKDRDRGKATANGTAFNAEDAETAEKGGNRGKRRDGKRHGSSPQPRGPLS